MWWIRNNRQEAARRHTARGRGHQIRHPLFVEPRAEDGGGLRNESLEDRAEGVQGVEEFSVAVIRQRRPSVPNTEPPNFIDLVVGDEGLRLGRRRRPVMHDLGPAAPIHVTHVGGGGYRA